MGLLGRVVFLQRLRVELVEKTLDLSSVFACQFH